MNETMNNEPRTVNGETFTRYGEGYALDLKSLSVEIRAPYRGNPWTLSIGDNEQVLRTKALSFSALEDALEAGSILAKAIRQVNDLQRKSMEREN